MTRNRIAASVILALVAIATGCEESDITAPEGSSITLLASPGTVFIDQDAGETEGQTTMVATVTDEAGLPLEEIPLFFSADGGLLASVDNACTDAGTCSRSPGDVCTENRDCPVLGPQIKKTNADGVVTDTLTLRLVEDPDQVTVTVRGTNLESTRSVTKTVNLGPDDPVANIDVDPPVGQRTGLPFQLDGSGSTFDPQVDLTCFDWNIVSSVRVFLPSNGTDGVGCMPCASPGTALCSNSCTDRGPTRSILALSIGEVGDEDLDQDLSIALRVSDDPDIVPTCNNSSTVEESLFGPFPDTTSYQIRCDLTDPNVSAGGDRSASLGPDDEVSITLTATASDPEDVPPLDFEWDCGNGTGGNTQSVTCTYFNEGLFTATITVTNDCQRSSSDSLIVEIDP